MQFEIIQPTEALRPYITRYVFVRADGSTDTMAPPVDDLYDEVAMPPELRTAHRENDRAVMAAYGMTPGKTTESECVAELFKMYQNLTK